MAPARASILRQMFLASFCAGFGGLAGCASVPKIDQNVGLPSATAPKPEIIGARGPLTAQQSKTLLARLSTEPATPACSSAILRSNRRWPRVL
jgi:hypothetical protein